MTSQVVGILTGGGDAPGLNAAICGAVRRLSEANAKVIGFRDGWRGVMDDEGEELVIHSPRDVLTRGGTVLGTSSASPYRGCDDGVARVRATFERRGLTGMIAIGGDGTLQASDRLHREEGLPVVAIPKTIDNDVPATDFTFGFFSAVERCTRAMDDLRTTADSHQRVIVVECMGRHAGWIAAYSGVAAAAEAIMVPERPVDLVRLYERLEMLRSSGRKSAILAIAEGTRLLENGQLLSSDERDEFGEYVIGGVAQMVAKRIQEQLGWEARAVVLGHLQRSGSPIAFDRIFALRLGARAAKLVLQGKFGRMSALHRGEVSDVPFADAVGAQKKLTDRFLDRYEGFFVP